MRKFLILIAILAMPSMAMAAEIGSLDTTHIFDHAVFERAYGSPWIGATGTLDSIVALIEGDGVASNFKFGIYKRSDSSFVDTTVTFSLNHSGVARVARAVFTGASIAAADSYIIEIWGASGDDKIIRGYWAEQNLSAWRTVTATYPGGAKHGLEFNAIDYFTPAVAVYHTGATPPDTLALCSIDSLHNDASAESDSIWLKWTPKSEAGNDSVRMAHSTSAYPDSSNATLQGKIYTASTADSLKIVVSGTETYTLYASFWVWDATNGWSTRKQRSRVFTGAASTGSLIGIIK